MLGSAVLFTCVLAVSMADRAIQFRREMFWPTAIGALITAFGVFVLLAH